MIALAAILGLIVILSAGCTGIPEEGAVSQDPDKTSDSPILTKSIRIGYLPTNGHALVFIAEEQGYFKEQGLDVELYQFQNSAEGSNAIIAKKIDAGGFGPSPLVYASKGSPVTIFSGLMGEGAGLVALPEKAQEFTDISSFVGKNVATVRMSSGDIHFRGSFEKAGYDLTKDITIHELASPSAVMDAVKAKKVDAGVVWTPYMEMAEHQGLTVVFYTSEQYPKHPCCRVAALTENVEADRDLYIRMEKALIQAYRFAQVNPDGAVDDVIKYVKIDRDVLKKAMESPHTYISPDPNLNGIVETYDLLKTIGYIETDVDIRNHVDTSIYKQALDELAAKNPDDPVYRQLQADYRLLDQ